MAVYLGSNKVEVHGLADLSGTINNQNKTVDPSTSQIQVTYDSAQGYTGLGTVTVNAMPSLTLPTSASSSATSGYSSKATIGRSTSDQYINIGTGYNSAGAYYKISAVPNGTAGTPVASKGTVSNHSISITPSVTNTAGYISGETKTGTAVSVTASELASGNKSITSNGSNIDVVGYSTVSVNVPTGSTINNQDKTVTPSTSEQSISADDGYTGLGTVTVYAMPTGTAGTPSASKGTVSNHSISVTPSVTNTTGYITGGTKTGTAVSVSASELVSGNLQITQNGTGINVANYSTVSVAVPTSSPTLITKNITANGTYNASSDNADGYSSVVVNVSGGGGGSGLTVATATATLNSANTSISFTGLAGEPTSFAVVSAAELATGASPWKTAAVVFDGTNLHGQTIRNTSNAQVTYDGSNFSKTYSNGTLTITGSGTNFQANQYKLVYTYGGSDIGTANVQVGSGATSITFTGLEEQPSYFSCIFKSNFSTSSGYQRVIAVVYDGTSTYGMEMDSSAKASTAHWSYTYNNGSLTISSQGTNAGGYFHQPGYYQLTYATEGGGGGTVNLQEKTNINPTTSSQTIVADVGYDGLSSVQINAMPSGSAGTPTASKGTVSNHSISVTPSVTNTTGYITGGTKSGTAVSVSASELVSGTLPITQNGTTDVTNYASVNVAVPTGADIPIFTINVTTNPITVTCNKTYTECYSLYNTGVAGALAEIVTSNSTLNMAMDAYMALNNAYMRFAIFNEQGVPIADVTYLANDTCSYSEPSGLAIEAGTPTATKGTVSNHSVSVTPSVTNNTGYITGGTKTGTAVTVSASELVSGSETKTSNGTYDVTNLAELVVSVSGSSPTIQSLSITPSTSEQTFNSSSVDGYKPVTVAAMPTMTLPTAVSTTSSGTSKATLSLTGGTRYLNIPTGYNSTAQYYTLSVANGSATGPSSITQSSATVSTGTNTLTLTKTNVTTTPTVSAGYVSSATASTATVALTASVTTKAATTYHPSTTAQSISSGTYLTGAQTIAAVTTSNLSASNIVSGVTIKVGDSSDDDCVASVTGNVVLQNYYTGSSAPSSSTGSNGDLYLQS